jgi:hypothetical protein
MYQANSPLSPRETLPTMYDLPSEDRSEFGVPDEFHNFQPELLRIPFRPPNYSSPSQLPIPHSPMNKEIQSYQDLRVWQVGMDLAGRCYSLTKSFPKGEICGMTSQIR